MAKTGVFEADPAARAARVTELKKELQRLVRIIAGDEECGVEAIDQAREALHALRELRARRRSSLSLACPEEYRCPISKELMRDPVIVATGQTYDRPSIQKWLKAGNRTCPQTQQVLTHTILTPNNLIRDLILRWCKSRGFELSEPVHCIDEDSITESERDRFLNLLEKMTSNISEQKEAAKELRSLTKRMPSFRALFGESPDAITQLLSPLSERKSPSGTHLDLQEDVITTLLNLSIHDNNKKLVAEIPSAIPLLMDALRSGTIETRSNAAAALFTLSALDSNKILIGKSGALKFLIDLLDEGHPLAMTDVASAIFNLCIVHENRDRAVQDGAVGVILEKIANRIHVDELLALLAMLSSHQRAIEEMCELAAVPCLLGVMRETACARNKENCIAILHTICVNDRTKLKELREEENSHGTVSNLAKNGTSRAQRKANWILGKLNRAINFTHTA